MVRWAKDGKDGKDHKDSKEKGERGNSQSAIRDTLDSTPYRAAPVTDIILR